MKVEFWIGPQFRTEYYFAAHTNLFTSMEIKYMNPHVFSPSNKLDSIIWFQWSWFYSAWHVVALHQPKTEMIIKIKLHIYTSSFINILGSKNEHKILATKHANEYWNLLICIPKLDTKPICGCYISTILAHFRTSHWWFSLKRMNYVTSSCVP